MSFHPIWAIARNTLAQAIRVRVAFVIMGVYLVLVPTLPFLLVGDQTLRGLLRVVITYSFMAAGFLLGLLTLALSTTTLWSEIKEKQIFVLESKPVRRWQVLVGKLVGILAIDAALLAFMGLVTWGCVQYIYHQSRWEKGEYGIARTLAAQQVLTTRRIVQPEEPDLSKGIDDLYENTLRKRPERLRGKTEAEIKEEMRQEFLNVINALTPMRARVWRPRDLPTDLAGKANLTIRFKFAASGGEKSDDPVDVRWLIGKMEDPRARTGYGAFTPDESHEVQVPASTVADDGVLEVHLLNVDRHGRTIVFSGPDALLVLVPVGGFAANLARGLGLVFVEVLFLAILGLFCSTFLTFPVSPIVAVSLLLLIYLTGAVHSEFQEQIQLQTPDQIAHAPLGQRVMQGLTWVLRKVLPPLDDYSPAAKVAGGEEVSWLSLLGALGLVALLRGGVLILFGVLIFERRELALAST